MAWASFLFTLHTAAEIFLVGVERLTLLEQVKTGNWQVIVAEVGCRMNGGGLILSACGLLLTVRCFGILCRIGLRLIIGTSIF